MYNLRATQHSRTTVILQFDHLDTFIIIRPQVCVTGEIIGVTWEFMKLSPMGFSATIYGFRHAFIYLF